MQGKKIAIASDHAGCELKRQLEDMLVQAGYIVVDYGPDCGQSPVDYPDKAALLAKGIYRREADIGILICGTGIGMSIAVNRYPFIRGALVDSVELAELARRHNNANVLILGGRMISFETAKACLDAFLTTPFEGGRHEARVQKLERMPDDCDN